MLVSFCVLASSIYPVTVVKDSGKMEVDYFVFDDSEGRYEDRLTNCASFHEEDVDEEGEVEEDKELS